jgi:hypothetical protein
MEPHLETIRTALLAEATDDQRHQGVAAARAILAALDTKPGEVLAPSESTSAVSPAPSLPTPDVASIIGAMRALGPDQLLDLAIIKLRGAVPDFDAGPRMLSPVRFHLVPVPPVKP